MKKGKLIFGLIFCIASWILNDANELEALPGYGGTITKACIEYVCTGICFDAGVQAEGVPFSIEGGYGWTAVSGTERFCGDENRYCAWDWGCQI